MPGQKEIPPVPRAPAGGRRLSFAMTNFQVRMTKEFPVGRAAPRAPQSPAFIGRRARSDAPHLKTEALWDLGSGHCLDIGRSLVISSDCPATEPHYITA